MRTVPLIGGAGLLILGGLVLGCCLMLDGCKKEQQVPSGNPVPVNEGAVPKPDASASPAAALIPTPVPAPASASPGS
jgi:hypothetical protein